MSGFLDAKGVNHLAETDFHLQKVLAHVYAVPPIPRGAPLHFYLDPELCCRPWRQGNGRGVSSWLQRPIRLLLALVEHQIDWEPSPWQDERRFMCITTLLDETFFIRVTRNNIFLSYQRPGLRCSSGISEDLPLRDSEVLGFLENHLNQLVTIGAAAKKIAVSGWCTHACHILDGLVSRGLLTQEGKDYVLQ